MKNKATNGSKLPHTPIPVIFEGRPFAVRALTVLLFGQAIAFIWLAIATIDWSRPVAALFLLYAPELAYLVMGLLNLIGAVGFLRLRPAAWLMAMFVQMMYLLLALILYLVERPEDYLFYGLMALSVVIVVYLNYAEVPSLFLRWRASDQDSNLGTANIGYYEDLAD